MTSEYQRQRDAEEDDEEMLQLRQTEIVFSRMRARGQHWPTAIGVVEIFIGFILSVLGVIEVFILPMAESKDSKDIIIFDKRNCYGVGMFAGFVMILTGSTAIRASISQRNTTATRFLNLTIISLLVYGGLTIMLIVAYSQGWTSPDQYDDSSRMPEVHVFLTIMTVMGLLFALTAFVQYFDVICCGDFPIWIQWAKCFCCCFYGQRQRRMSFEQVFREEMDNGNSSNPI